MRCELRRRVSLSGRLGSLPEAIAADRLWLCTPDGHRLLRARVSAGGLFFFLDVAPGRYALHRLDAGGAVVQALDVVLPAAEAGVRPPIVTLDLEGAPPSSPGRRRGRGRLV
jgi:hypothetical protein